MKLQILIFIGLSFLSDITTKAQTNTFPAIGNVGIGTINPLFNLQINSSQPIISLISTNTLDPAAALRGPNDTWLFGYGGLAGQEDISIGTQDGSGSRSLTFAAGGKARIKVLPDGNVGIGTITPDSKLTVAGKIHSQEVKVSVDAGADFVFDKNYHLTSLTEIEDYIQANKHLPEIASAAEMEKNGIDLGKMNIQLLWKVEELTMYLIGQEKRIVKQNIIIDELREISMNQQKEINELKKQK